MKKNCECKNCQRQRAAMKKWRAAHPDYYRTPERLAYKRKWYRAHREKHKKAREIESSTVNLLKTAS